MNSFHEPSKEILEEELYTKLTTKKFNKITTSLKCEFSLKVNEYIINNIMNRISDILKDDLISHLTSRIFFNFNFGRIPFIPIYTSGYMLGIILHQLNIPAILYYRHFIIHNGEIILNGIEPLVLMNNKLYRNHEYLNNNTRNFIVIECYSVIFMDPTTENNSTINNIPSNYPYKKTFPLHKDFNTVVNNMVDQFDFMETIQCTESRHKLFSKQPYVISNGKKTEFKYDDFSSEYNESFNNGIKERGGSRVWC